MRDLRKEKNKSVTITLYLQICRNGCFWSKQKRFSMKRKLFPNGNGASDAMEQLLQAKIHRKSRNKNHFKVSATPIPDLDQNRKRLFIKALIPCKVYRYTKTYRCWWTFETQHKALSPVVAVSPLALYSQRCGGYTMWRYPILQHPASSVARGNWTWDLCFDTM